MMLLDNTLMLLDNTLMLLRERSKRLLLKQREVAEASSKAILSLIKPRPLLKK